MKAQYGILRFKKYKGPAISPIEAHNERTKEQYASNPDIDTTGAATTFIWCSRRAGTGKKPTA